MISRVLCVQKLYFVPKFFQRLLAHEFSRASFRVCSTILIILVDYMELGVGIVEHMVALEYNAHFLYLPFSPVALSSPLILSSV